MGGHLYSPDEEILFRTAESFALGRGGAIEPLGGVARVLNERGEVEIKREQGFATRQGTGGQEYAQYGIGQPLLAVPLVWSGKVFTRVASDSMLEVLHIDGLQYHERTVRSYALRLPASRFNQLITALTAYLIYLLVGHLYQNRRAAIATALIYVSATLALPHSKTFFTEPLAGLCALGSFGLLVRSAHLWASDRARGKSALVYSGFLLGYGILTRLDTVMFAPGIALFGYLALWRGRLHSASEKWRVLLSWGIPLAGCVCVVFVLNAIRFGSPLASGYSDQPEGVQFSTPLWIGLYGFLFSSGKSLFLFSPPLLLAPIGWWKLRQRNISAAAGLGVCVLLFLLFQAKWRNWEGGWCWGPRHIFQITPMLAVCLGWLFAEPKVLAKAWQRIGLTVIITAGLLVNLLGVAASFIDVYSKLPTQDHVRTLFEPLYTLPRLHYLLMTHGQWDLLIPRMLAGPAPILRAAACMVFVVLGISVWGLWKTWPRKVEC